MNAPVPDPEDAPAELRERDQWLMWDASNDAPRRPHWRGNFSVSWSNPDDWHSFDEAREAALKRDSWGIGYVLANGKTDKLNYPRGIYGGLDIDGCLIEEGRPKEWLPSLEPFIDRGAYMEYSPSTYDDSEKDGGIKIPIVGFEPPSWWSNVEFEDREHEGVEAYDAKFFTVTGRSLTDDGSLVVEDGEWVDEWLAQAHKSITGDDPRNPTGEGGSSDSQDGISTGENGSRGEWMDADTAREALEHVDADVSYPTWRDIGFALADEFSTGTALSIFEGWSRGGSKWDADAERQAKQIVEDATSGGGRTISTIVHYAKRGGWDASGAARAATASDGGTAAVQVGESDAKAAVHDDDNDGYVWRTVRELYQSSENGTSGEATQAAAMHLLDEFEAVTVEENDTIWRYNSDTGTFSDDGVPRLRKRLADGLGRTYSRSRVTDILHRVRSETYAKRDALGAPEDMICVENGVLDLTDPKNPEIVPHSPEYRFTWGMSAPYDPDAEATMFRQFLGGSVRPEDIPKLQEYAGDALRHWKQPRNLCVLLGPTDSGKGVFIRALRGVFGGDNVASETLRELTDTRWGAFSLQHRPINLANELSTGTLDSPERAKNFSGDGDTVSVEDKGESKFEMTPTANHIFATNQVPQVSNADPAFYNRWLFVTFPTSVPAEEQDEELDTRMTESDEERAGILNWLIEGYARRRSRTGTGFDCERSIAEKEDMWSAYGTSIDRFVATCVTTDGASDGDSVAKKDAYTVYKTMCNDVGISVESQQKLTAELKKEEGVGDGKRKVDAHFDDAARARVFTGVQWTDDGEKYLNRAINARESAAAQADTDDQQSGLNGDSWEMPGSEISQRQAVRSIMDTVKGLTEETGGPVHIDTVVENVPHAEKRARHIIGNKITEGPLIEAPDDHVSPRD